MNEKYIPAVIILVICTALCPAGPLYAASGQRETSLYLKNGDRISGRVVAEDEKEIAIENEALGRVVIKKDFIRGSPSSRKEEAAAVKEERPKLWEREVAIGYGKSSGNTKNSLFSAELWANRKTDKDEFTIKGNTFYSSSNNKMDAQKWYGMLRYAFSFWGRKWYDFYRLESDHDRFANVNYRLVPATGIGYWFSDSADWKALLEMGIGLEHTDFRDETKDRNETVIIPRAFLEKKVFFNSRISQDITLYPSLSYAGDYRLHSETAFITPVSEKLDLKFSLIDDYNSHPDQYAKKNDMQIISSLSYSF